MKLRSWLALLCAVASCSGTSEEASSGQASSSLVASEPQSNELTAALTTTSATAGDGTRYVAGAFTRRLLVGTVALVSHGGADIFLTRLDPRGRVVWARGIGSTRDESDPKVTFENDRVTLLGVTEGAVDCGRGPMTAWSTEAFFVCTYDARGELRVAGVFPTGRPSAVYLR